MSRFLATAAHRSKTIELYKGFLTLTQYIIQAGRRSSKYIGPLKVSQENTSHGFQGLCTHILSCEQAFRRQGTGKAPLSRNKFTRERRSRNEGLTSEWNTLNALAAMNFEPAHHSFRIMGEGRHSMGRYYVTVLRGL